MTTPDEDIEKVHVEEKKTEHVDETAEADVKTAPNQTNQTNKTIFWFTVIIVISGLIWACLWFFYFQFYESTDDAYSNGNMININSAIQGSVIAFYADDTDLVVEGQLLALLDPTDYLVEYEKSLAALASSVLQVRQLYDTVHVNRATVDSKRVALSKARYDFKNRAKLIDSKAVSNEDYTHAKDTLDIAVLELKQAEAQLQVSIDAAGNSPVEDHPIIQEHKSAVRQAYYYLRHCSIYAPAKGYIAQRNVNVGQWVTPNTALMAVIPTDYVWVDANFKETQLPHMRVGQPAKVTFDLYGTSVEYIGEVLGIASGSGSVFSLIPPQNATGNWIKIVQRLPVRISLDAETVKKYPVRLGISAEVRVDITDRNLPMLTQIPPKRAIGTTDVFDVQLEEADKIIDVIIKSQLKEK